MSLIILNGPTGTGKNTISTLIAKKRKKCAIIDFDQLRMMFVQPHKAPWQGEEGHFQQILGVEHACLLSKSFIEKDFDVIVLDVLSEETANIYKNKLKEYRPQLILLLPSWEEIQHRNKTRPPRLTDDELLMVYQQQTQIEIYDQKIDNTNMSPEEVAEIINKLIDS